MAAYTKVLNYDTLYQLYYNKHTTFKNKLARKQEKYFDRKHK